MIRNCKKKKMTRFMTNGRKSADFRYSFFCKNDEKIRKKINNLRINQHSSTRKSSAEYFSCYFPRSKQIIQFLRNQNYIEICKDCRTYFMIYS